MDEQIQAQSFAHEGESRDLPGSEPAAVEFDDAVASTAVDFNAGSVAEEAPETAGLLDRREAPPTASAPVIAPHTAIHLERLLYRLGFDPGPIDGVIEPMTVEAVMLFQEEDGRETTGEIDHQLIASLEDRLFESFRRHRESLRRQSSANPEPTPAIKPTSRPETAPPANEQARQRAAAYGARQPVAEKRTRPSTPDARPLEGPAQELATRIEPPRANASQQVRLEAKGKETGDSEPNPFEACARSGQQGEYLKTQSGFVLCEEFSFDAGIRR
jgi:peptidoglycan hydrolase-like protein with peptidoglycan-binding domain